MKKMWGVEYPGRRKKKGTEKQTRRGTKERRGKIGTKGPDETAWTNEKCDIGEFDGDFITWGRFQRWVINREMKRGGGHPK